jgi:hypothetical protein
MEAAKFVRGHPEDGTEMAAKVGGIAEAEGVSELLNPHSGVEKALGNRLAASMHPRARRRQSKAISVALAKSFDSHPRRFRRCRDIEWTSHLGANQAMTCGQASFVLDGVAAQGKDGTVQPPLCFLRINDPAMFEISDEPPQWVERGVRRSSHRACPVEDALDFEQGQEWSAGIEEGLLPSLVRSWPVFVAQARKEQEGRPGANYFHQTLTIAVGSRTPFKDEEAMHPQVASIVSPAMGGELAGSSTMEDQFFTEQAPASEAGPGISRFDHLRKIPKHSPSASSYLDMGTIDQTIRR